MEIQNPITVEELQEANVLAVPRLLRGSVRRQATQNIRPSKWRLAVFGVIIVLYLVRILFDPNMGGMARWGLLVLLAAVALYRLIYAPKIALKGYGSRIDRMPQVTSVDTDGVRYTDKNQMGGFRPWSGYTKWREGQLIFTVRGPQRAYNVIPKRGLTPEQIDNLRNMLRVHMPTSG